MSSQTEFKYSEFISIAVAIMSGEGSFLRKGVWNLAGIETLVKGKCRPWPFRLICIHEGSQNRLKKFDSNKREKWEGVTKQLGFHMRTI